jgi:hypothetical protein
VAHQPSRTTVLADRGRRGLRAAPLFLPALFALLCSTAPRRAWAQQSAADYRLWAADPWSSFERQLDGGAAGIPTRDVRIVSFALARHGYDASAIMIGNLSATDALLCRVVVSDFLRRGSARPQGL